MVGPGDKTSGLVQQNAGLSMKHVKSEYLEDYEDRINKLSEQALEELNEEAHDLYSIYQPGEGKMENLPALSTWEASSADSRDCNNS